MAKNTAPAKTPGENRSEGEGALPVSEATDGGDSRLTKGYGENPDVPDPTSIAQVEHLHDDENPDDES